jgi:hypothetical protein
MSAEKNIISRYVEMVTTPKGVKMVEIWVYVRVVGKIW